MTDEREKRIGLLFVEASEMIEAIVARRVHAPQATIEDACAHAWSRLVTRPDVVDAPRERALGWLTRVAEREAWRLSGLEHDVASRDVLAVLEGQAGSEDPVEHVAQREVLRALAGLPPRQRRALELQAQGYSYREIAALSRVADVASVEAAVVSLDDMSSTRVKRRLSLRVRER